jgi:hypothetical protein
MRYFRLALLILVCFVCSASVLGQQSTSGAATTPTSDPQAVALLQRALSALTGAVSISDVTLTGTAQRLAGSDDETGTATLKASATEDSRVDLSFPSGSHSEIRNHAAIPLSGALPSGVPASLSQTPQPVGVWSDPDGVLHGMAAHNIMTDATWFFPVLTLEKIASAQNYVFSYIGQETHDGITVLHVSASQQFPQLAQNSSTSNSPGPSPAQFQALVQHLSRMDFYIDPNSSLPTALDFNSHPDDNASIDIATEILFSGYQKIGGVLVPLHVQKYLNNSLVLDLQLSDASINSGLSASTFALQ